MSHDSNDSHDGHDGHDNRDEVEQQLREQEERRARGKLGAWTLHATHDSQALTRKAFETRMENFRKQADPTGELAQKNPQELARRTQALLNADMSRLRLAKLKKARERADAAAQGKQHKQDKRRNERGDDQTHQQ